MQRLMAATEMYRGHSSVSRWTPPTPSALRRRAGAGRAAANQRRRHGKGDDSRNRQRYQWRHVADTRIIAVRDKDKVSGCDHHDRA